MYTIEIKKYHFLNEIAERVETVIFGGSEDAAIPAGELHQAFAMETALYNRSFQNLSVEDGIKLYDSCIHPLHPQTLLLHIGEADLEDFAENSTAFDQKYRSLISHIRQQDKKCTIAIISLKNQKGCKDIAEMNRHLKHIAESKRCEFFDISEKTLRNPQVMKQISFLQTTGFVRRLPSRQPIANTVKILYGFI